MNISRYVGLDVHKDTISVAYALPGRGEPVSHGMVVNTPRALQRLISKLSPNGEALSFYYEAGPCGYGIFRAIEEAGHSCVVVAPSLVPRRPGDRVKTDRRDALSLARQHRSGDLTPVWVPGPEQEAMRDLLRARDDMKGIELRARQRLGAFLLRHGRIYGRSNWTQAHFRWLEDQKFGQPSQQIVMQEYVNAVQGAQAQVAKMDAQIREAVQEWSLRPTVEALMALRGVDLLCATTLLAELGDISRFDNPPPVDGLRGPGSLRTFFRVPAAKGCHHQDRQRPCPAHSDRSGMVLPLPGAEDPAYAAEENSRLPTFRRSHGRRRNASAGAFAASTPWGRSEPRWPPPSHGKFSASSGPSSRKPWLPAPTAVVGGKQQMACRPDAEDRVEP